jgi:hypothetical protein
MKMNIALNGVGEDEPANDAKEEVNGTHEESEERNGESSAMANPPDRAEESAAVEQSVFTGGTSDNGRREGCNGKVRTNQGDAW